MNSLKGFLSLNKLRLAERIENVRRLHCALELVIMLDQFVNIPHPDLAKAARYVRIELYQREEHCQVSAQSFMRPPPPQKKKRKTMCSCLGCVCSHNR